MNGHILLNSFLIGSKLFAAFFTVCALPTIEQHPEEGAEESFISHSGICAVCTQRIVIMT